VIHFACPRCDTEIAEPDEAVGSKLACLVCGQRVQVPGLPPVNKTMLGEPLVMLRLATPPPLPVTAAVVAAPSCPPPLPGNKKIGALALLVTGGVLIVGGAVGTICFLNMETTVEVVVPPRLRVQSRVYHSGAAYHDALTEASLNSDPDDYRPKLRRFDDEGLRDQRRNGLIVSLASTN